MAPWRPSRGPLGTSCGPLGGLLGGSWGLLGTSWSLLGPFGAHLGTLWEPFGASLGLLRLLESCLDGLGSHLGAKKAPKSAQNRPPRQRKSLSERMPQATAHYVQMPINLDRYFHEVEECKKNVHPSKTSILTVSYEGFVRSAFFAFA